MIQALIDKLFGRSKEEEQPQQASRDERRPKIKQVLEGPEVDTPEFAAEVTGSDLVAACAQNVVCQYKPHIEYQRIYRPGRRRVGGDLDVKYEGVAGSCAAMKTAGKQVASEDGLIQPYRYVDLNHIFRCCCGDPRKCRFYRYAKEEREQMHDQMKKIGQ